MKTRFLSTIAILLIGLTTALADANDAAKPNVPTDAARLLEKNITYPFRAQHNQVWGAVSFELKVDENKTVKFVPINSDSDILSESVKRQVMRMESKLAKLIEPGSSQQFKLHFVLK